MTQVLTSVLALPSVILMHTARIGTATTWTIDKARNAIGTFGKAMAAEWIERKASGRVPHIAANRLRRVAADYVRGHATEADLLAAEARLAESEAWAASLVRVVATLDRSRPVWNTANGAAITLESVIAMVFAPETSAQTERTIRAAIAADAAPKGK